MKLLHLGFVALATALTCPAMAQTGPTSTDMKILAQKVKADKKLLVAVNMQLTESEARGFWPIYDAYQKDLESIDNRLAKTILAYAEAYNSGPVPDDAAKTLIDEYLAIGDDEAKLNRSYVPKLASVLPGTKVARYIQIESKIRAALRYDLAGRIPLVQ